LGPRLPPRLPLDPDLAARPRRPAGLGDHRHRDAADGLPPSGAS
jgi:hypothetical protein